MSGIQPTGDPTLGNYLGALQNWVVLQNQLGPQDQMFLSVVDLHAMSGSGHNLAQLSREAAATIIATGIDPGRVVLFRQSAVPAHAELATVLGALTPLGHLYRMTQFKDKAGASPSLALLSYPVLQAADILLYRASLVPVGIDQAQHLELAREVARFFNRRVGEDYLVEPATLLTESRKIMSLRDAAKKMSKSDPHPAARILLADSPDAIRAKILKAKTDQTSAVTAGPERPEVTNLLNIYGKSIPAVVAEFEGQDTHKTPDYQFKLALASVLAAHLAPIAARRAELLADPAHIDRLLAAGAEAARAAAAVTMTRVRQLIGLDD